MPTKQANTLDEYRIVGRDDEAEKLVLSSVVLNTMETETVLQLLTPEMFFLHVHSVTFKAIIELASKGKGYDLPLLVKHLKKSKDKNEFGSGVESFLAELATMNTTPGYAKFYAGIVRDNFIKRNAYAASARMNEMCQSDDVSSDEMLDNLEQLVHSLRDKQRVNGDSVRDIGDIMLEVMRTLDRRSNGELRGLSTGFVDLDKIIRLRGGELGIIAARPSMGKTAFVLNVAANVSRNEPVLFVSLEMGASELCERLVASELRINAMHLKEGTITDIERDAILEFQATKPCKIDIDDSPMRTVFDIASVARRMKRKEGLGMVVVDYLQLIRPLNNKIPRQEQVAEMSRQLKQLARELDVPVLVLAQLNRQIESTTDAMPKLSHLRESGAIEQDADIVMFVHRPAYFDKTKPSNEAFIIVAKNRNGQTGQVPLCWFPEYTRFDSQAKAVAEQNYNHEFDSYNPVDDNHPF